MYLDNISGQGRPVRLQAQKTIKPISFSLVAPQAQRVSLVGDFNQWNPNATPMRRQADGGWMAQVDLTHGHHRYVFMVDDEMVLDPRGHGTARLDDNIRVSLVAVS